MLSESSPSPEYAHTPIERLDMLGSLVLWCEACGVAFPCHAQRVDASNAARELAAYFARYGASGYAHADAIAAAVAA